MFLEIRKDLMKGKALYNWPPCANLFKWTVLILQTLFAFSKQPTLIRRSSVQSLPLRLVFPAWIILTKSICPLYTLLSIYQRAPWYCCCYCWDQPKLPCVCPGNTKGEVSLYHWPPVSRWAITAPLLVRWQPIDRNSSTDNSSTDNWSTAKLIDPTCRQP